MIPRRIALSGFLCYRDEQVIDFDGCDLWVFTGRNGSGKSTIFDAMTFALFGAHRGGRQDFASLINAHANELQVVFDFDLGSDLYRIRRSLPRNGQAECQLFRFEPGGEGPGRWPAVPEAGSITKMSRWVGENLGLTYETFTASVLLMQGQAERLLGALPKQRFEILSGIVDLARYQRLHKQAELRRQESKNQAETFRNQLRLLPGVSEAEVEESKDSLARTQEDHAAAHSVWKRLVELEHRARTWQDLTDRRDEARRGHDHARDLLVDSAAIVRDRARLEELDSVLAALREALERRAKLERVEAELRRLKQERLTIDRKLDLIQGLAADNRSHRDAIVEEIDRDERRKQVILERQAALSLPIQRRAMAHKQRAEVLRLEQALAAYPGDLEAEIASLEVEHRHGLEWQVALPFLTSLIRHRDALAEARQRIAEADCALAAGEAETNRLESTLERCRAESQAAIEDERESRDRRTEAAGIRRAAAARLEKFEGLRGASNCDSCGQLLTAAHYAAEAARLRAECDQAARSLEVAAQAYDAAKDRQAAAEAAQGATERSLHQAREMMARTRHNRLHAESEARSRIHECNAAYESLTAPFQCSVAKTVPEDWLAAAFPTTDELDEGRRQISGIGPLASRLAQARRQWQDMQGERTRLEQARQSLAAVGWEPTDDAAEAEHASLSTEAADLVRCLAGHAKERDLARATLAKLETIFAELSRRGAEAEIRIAAEQTWIESWTEELTRARLTLPESWHAVFDSANAAEIEAYDGERRDLRDRGVESRAAELPQAQRLFEQARVEIADLDRQIAEIPEEARRAPDGVASLQAEAEERLRRADETRNTCQRNHDALLQRQEHRQSLTAQLFEAERRQDVLEALTRLLGRDGLQRDLLRDAEQGIVDCANPILQEISGGELELCLLAGDDGSDHALEMEAIVRTHGQTCRHDVVYLSGSQRFRVAVSLALAIGQFARGGGPNSVGAVIIDEGFGCLDRQGLDEMKAELTRLKGQLRRIILVSHQEDFAKAFDDGYHFEIIDGATVVQPFHR